MQKNDKFIDGLSRRKVKSVSKLGLEHDVAPRRYVLAMEKQKRARERKMAEKKALEDFIKPVKSLDFGLTDEDLFGKKKIKNSIKKQKSWWLRHKKISVSLIVFLFLVSGGFLAGNKLIANLTNNKSGLFDVIMATIGEDKPLKKDKNGLSNILVFGTSGYDMNGTSGGGKHDGSQLTDSIMVVSLDQKNKSVKLLSLPRDLKVNNDCAVGTEKINEVYWCHKEQAGKEKTGAEALAKQVKSVTGIDLHYFAHINWSSLVKIVDTLGGITVTLDEDIQDIPTKTFIKAGVPVNLDGEKALGLARARYGTEHGDLTRGNSQQKILMAIKNKITQKKLDLGQILGLVNILGNNLSTDFSAGEMKTGVKIMSKISAKKIKQISLINTNDGDLVTTGTIGGVSYVIPEAGDKDYSQIKKHIKKQLKPAKKKAKKS